MKLNSKGLSAVVTTVILIALVMASISIVWVVVQNLVQKNLDQAQSCFDIYDKITIDKTLSCYNTSSGKLKILIEVGEISVDEILISVKNSEESKSFKIKNNTEVANVQMFDSSTIILIPEENSGIAYLVDLTSAGINNPLSISISPKISGNSCGISDTLQGIESC